MLSMSEIEQALRRATAGGAWRRAYEDGESWLKKWWVLMRAGAAGRALVAVV
jgi:hypothetical protein